MVAPRLGYPNLGLGVGLRTVHYRQILDRWPAVDWFEIISENYIDSQGRPREVLRRVAERYPIVMHGVSLSIGSTDPLDHDYLGRLKKLADELPAVWVSDHLCWTGVAGMNSHDLLPMPLTDESLEHTIGRVKQVQEFLERPLILENPSTYVEFQASTVSEPEFLRALCAATGCGLLLDLNNIYVSCTNHDRDPLEFLAAIPHERVVQFHLAGHTTFPTHIIDTHDHPVIDPVWELFARAHRLTGGVATLLEWDANIPPFETVHAEILKAHRYMGKSEGEVAPAVLPERVDYVAPAPHPLHLVRAEVE